MLAVRGPIRASYLRETAGKLGWLKPGVGTDRGATRDLMTTQSSTKPEPGERSLCSCTPLGHDEVRDAIRRSTYRQVEEVLEGLDFDNPDGCARCRPAIDYYLTCAHPASAPGDPQSRPVNERVHANIQQDGSFSVVPRLFGGVVTPEQLRVLADVAERHGVETIKVTGAQRIDLLGVPGERLVSVFEELNAGGMVSGHAYARAVRNVKACVGSRWCRYGHNDAVAMATELEEMTWATATPHKFKLAVSACYRNCAEATIKDFGIVAMEEGFRLFVGGSGGIRVRAGQLLAHVHSEREVLELCGGFLQLYREEAHYGERSWGFIRRVGMDYVRERVVRDPAGRSALFRRLLVSVRHRQRDPWESRVGEAPTDFVPLRRLTRREAS